MHKDASNFEESTKDLNGTSREINVLGRKRKRPVRSSRSSTRNIHKEDAIVDEYILKEDIKKDHGKFDIYSKDKRWKLEKIPHHILPSFNITPYTDVNDVREFPLLRVSLPHSVYVSPIQLNHVDICHRRTIALSSYMLGLKTIKTSYLSAKKKSKQVRKDEKKGIYNKSLIAFAKRRDINPDKYFRSDYDFYYTSGNLCVNPESSQILHVNGSHMEKLNLSVFNIDDSIVSIKPITNVTLTDLNKDDSEIFEVQFSRAERDSFFVRQKYCVSMYKYTDKICPIKQFRSKKVPLISFTEDRIKANRLAVSNLDHVVSIYDIETDLLIQKLKFVKEKHIKPVSNWNMIKSWDSNVYLYAESRRLNTIDIRVPESEWQSNYCGYDEENYCSTFCSLALSNFNNLFYVGSSHKLYCVDRRFMGKNIESQNTALIRWTHQMSSCPLMMATSCHNDCEYITLQSPVSADLRICENIQYLRDSGVRSGSTMKEPQITTVPKYIYKSPCLPFMPPSLENVFQDARRKGKCVKPESGIMHRIKASSTGLSFLENNTNSYILTATSNGDLFARHMFDENDGNYRLEEAVDVISNFEKNIFRSAKKAPLYVTQVCDLSGISKVFRCPILSGSEPVETVPTKRRYLGRWQKSIRSLHKYKDALVTNLLSVWDVEEEDEKDFNIKSLSQSAVADSTSLVSGWLNSNDAILHSTMINMTSIPIDVFNSSSAAFETTVDETLKNNDFTVQLENTTTTPAKSKGPKKKSRYTKGF